MMYLIAKNFLCQIEIWHISMIVEIEILQYDPSPFHIQYAQKLIISTYLYSTILLIDKIIVNYLLTECNIRFTLILSHAIKLGSLNKDIYDEKQKETNLIIRLLIYNISMSNGLCNISA